MSLKGKRVAVLVEKFYEDLELWYPYYRLKEAGCQVTLVGPKAGETYASKHGYPCKAEVAAADVTADDFDGIVIPGNAKCSRPSATARGCFVQPKVP